MDDRSRTFLKSSLAHTVILGCPRTPQCEIRDRLTFSSPFDHGTYKNFVAALFNLSEVCCQHWKEAISQFMLDKLSSLNNWNHRFRSFMLTFCLKISNHSLRQTYSTKGNQEGGRCLSQHCRWCITQRYLLQTSSLHTYYATHTVFMMFDPQSPVCLDNLVVSYHTQLRYTELPPSTAEVVGSGTDLE